MNREQKRMLQRQGELGPDGQPARRQPQPRGAPKAKESRTSPRQFVGEVRGELRKVAWPTRDKVIRDSIVVLVTLILITAFIAGADTAFGKAVLFLFDIE